MKKLILKKPTSVFRRNPNATGDWNQNIVVRTLPEGTEVNVIKEGETRTSWSSTPILYINKDEWINKPIEPTRQQPIKIVAEIPQQLTEMDKDFKMDKTTMLLSSVGALGGAYYAFTQKKGLWGYVGFILLGGVVGSLAANVLNAMKKEDKPTKESPTDTYGMPRVMEKPIPSKPDDFFEKRMENKRKQREECEKIHGANSLKCFGTIS